MMQKYQTLRLNNIPHLITIDLSLKYSVKDQRIVDKSDISGFMDNSDLDRKIAILSTKNKSKVVQEKKNESSSV